MQRKAEEDWKKKKISWLEKIGEKPKNSLEKIEKKENEKERQTKVGENCNI